MSYLTQRQVDAMSDADLDRVSLRDLPEWHSTQGAAARHPVTAVCSRCRWRWRAFGVTRKGVLPLGPLGTSWRLLLNDDPTAAGFEVTCPRCRLVRAVDAFALRHLVVLEGRRTVEL